MAILNEYVNVAFSLQIFSCKIENKKDSSRADNAVLFEHMVPKKCKLSFETKKFILRVLLCIYCLSCGKVCTVAKVGNILYWGIGSI